MNTKVHDWLDPIIEEQAAYYGLTVAEHKTWMDKLCEQQEEIECYGESYCHQAQHTTSTSDCIGEALLEKPIASKNPSRIHEL